MGKPKPLLHFRNTAFLEQIISQLKRSNVDRITVVLGAGAETIKKSIDLSGTDVVVNKDYRKGQLSSLIAGLENIPADTEAILVCLVDNPFITKAVVNRLISKFKETKSPIVVPVFNKKRGHPALFARSLFKELRNAPAQEGARHVLHSNEEKILKLEMPESGILVSIDTPEDYKLHFGVSP
jgi:molybdenum cofactor cytidylyltransferase